MAVRVGIDLVHTDDVRDSLQRHGQRYLNRIYTETEQRDCRADPRCLAARFAAKEATMKALRVRDEGLSWRSIEIAHDDRGQPRVQLTDEAAALAERRGVRRLAVSLTRQRSVAMAIVLADLEDGITQPSPTAV